MRITLVGFAGSGKDSVARHLIDTFGFIGHSFAESLKDMLATVFVWDREMLDGTTPESRQWRETVDHWWAERLGIPTFTPRYAMQHIGTDVMRRYFHDDLWILNIERKLAAYDWHQRVVLVDGRFPNELMMARGYGATIVRVRRGDEPSWYYMACKANHGDIDAYRSMTDLGIHASEWAWIGYPVDAVIDNDGTLADLQCRVEELLRG